MSLVPNAKHWWRMWSVRGSAVVGVLVAYMAANPAQIAALGNEVPLKYRALAVTAIGALSVAIPLLLRLLPQTSLPVASGETVAALAGQMVEAALTPPPAGSTTSSPTVGVVVTPAPPTGE